MSTAPKSSLTLSFWPWPSCRASVWVFKALQTSVCHTLPVQALLCFAMPAVFIKRQPLYRRNPPGETANFRTEWNLVQPLASINIIQPVSRGATLSFPFVNCKLRVCLTFIYSLWLLLHCSFASLLCTLESLLCDIANCVEAFFFRQQGQIKICLSHNGFSSI